MAPRSTNTSPLTKAQLENLRVAVYLAGGAAKVAKAMGYKTGESVRRFTTGAKPVPAERVEDFRRAVEGRLKLAEIRPDLYGRLSADRLGYAPKVPARSARA